MGNETTTRSGSQEKKYTLKDYKTEVHNDWCPGCGDFGILNAIQMALAELQLPPHKVAILSGIGCSGKTPHYINAYGFHTLHGRVLPVATAYKLVNHDLTVLAVGGDGDGYGIGAGYFLAAGRRNVDLTYIVFNNEVYALTKGQQSPTLAKGLKTKSMPEAAIQDGVNPIAVALGAGYTFVARGFALEPKKLAPLIVKAISHRGTALIDVLQTCPTYNDIHGKDYYAGADLPQKLSRIVYLEDEGYDGRVKDRNSLDEIIAKKSQAMAKSYEWGARIPCGIFYQVEFDTYEDHMAKKIAALKEKPLVSLDPFNRDITPLLEQLM